MKFRTRNYPKQNIAVKVVTPVRGMIPEGSMGYERREGGVREPYESVERINGCPNYFL